MLARSPRGQTWHRRRLWLKLDHISPFIIGHHFQTYRHRFMLWIWCFINKVKQNWKARSWCVFKPIGLWTLLWNPPAPPHVENENAEEVVFIRVQRGVAAASDNFLSASPDAYLKLFRVCFVSQRRPVLTFTSGQCCPNCGLVTPALISVSWQRLKGLILNKGSQCSVMESDNEIK